MIDYFNKCLIRRDKCSMSAFDCTSAASDDDHEKNVINEKAQDNMIEYNLLHSNTSLPNIAEGNDAFFQTNENSSEKISHGNTFVTPPRHELIPNNNTSTMRPLEKAECQKNCNSVVHNYSSCNDNLKCALGGVIIAMEKLQMQGDALGTSNSVLENSQNNETALNMFQDIARPYKSTFTSSPNTFNKSHQFKQKKSECVDAPSTKAVKMKPRKRLKKRKETEVAVGKARKPYCSFCNQIGHEISNCHVRNAYKAKHGPDLDAKMSKFGLISQIECCGINNLHDFSSGHPKSNLAKKDELSFDN